MRQYLTLDSPQVWKGSVYWLTKQTWMPPSPSPPVTAS